MAQLYPQALESLSIAFYDSQGYGRGILTLFDTGMKNKYLRLNFPTHTTRIKKKKGRKEKLFS
jgi:hypothetical protein